MVRHDADLSSTERRREGRLWGRVPDFQGGFSKPCGGGVESESAVKGLSRRGQTCVCSPASVALLVQPCPGELSSVPVLQRCWRSEPSG